MELFLSLYLYLLTHIGFTAGTNLTNADQFFRACRSLSNVRSLFYYTGVQHLSFLTLLVQLVPLVTRVNNMFSLHNAVCVVLFTGTQEHNNIYVEVMFLS